MHLIPVSVLFFVVFAQVASSAPQEPLVKDEGVEAPAESNVSKSKRHLNESLATADAKIETPPVQTRSADPQTDPKPLDKNTEDDEKPQFRNGFILDLHKTEESPSSLDTNLKADNKKVSSSPDSSPSFRKADDKIDNIEPTKYSDSGEPVKSLLENVEEVPRLLDSESLLDTTYDYLSAIEEDDSKSYHLFKRSDEDAASEYLGLNILPMYSPIVDERFYEE